MPVQISRRLLSVEDYHRMGEEMIIGYDEKVELIRGEIFNKFPKSPRHAFTRNRLTRILLNLSKNKAYLRVQGPLQIGQFSEPEPDISLLSLPGKQYEDAHPSPANVLLLIEIADVPLDYIEQIKLPLYAEAGIPEVWIINVAAAEVEQYREASGGKYRLRKLFPLETKLSLPALDAELSVNDILGK